MQWISRSADGQAYPVLLLPVALVQFNRWQVLIACFCAFALELAAYKLIKQSVKRPRPFRRLPGLANLIVPQDAFSFPSGHTAGAFLVAAIISYCHPPCLMPAYFWASLVGISRIYLRVHYPTDVVIGACLGFLSARAGLFAANYICLPNL
jgi:undecaprenyl-diphosphatase